jgi:hypothetical protein
MSNQRVYVYALTLTPSALCWNLSMSAIIRHFEIPEQFMKFWSAEPEHCGPSTLQSSNLQSGRVVAQAASTKCDPHLRSCSKIL